MSTVRVGIIGTGRAGRCQSVAFSRLEGVEVTGLWNRTRSRAEELAATIDAHEVQVYDDWNQLIEAVDVVSIATHPRLRLAPFAAALRQGRHVLVEKPLALGLAEAQEIAALADGADTVTTICLNWRYSPASQAMQKALQQGRIGRVLDARTEWRLCADPNAGPWKQVGGVLLEVGTHDIDRLRFLTGWQFGRVVCSLRRMQGTSEKDGTPLPSDAAAFVLAETTEGGIANLRLSFNPGQPERWTVICGEQGSLTMRCDWVSAAEEGGGLVTLSNEVCAWAQSAGDSDPVRLEIAPDDRQPDGVLSGQHTWNRLIKDFVAAVRRKDVRHETVPHLPSVADGLAVQQVIDACERSAAGNGWAEVGG